MTQSSYSDDVARQAICLEIADHFGADVVTSAQVKEFCAAKGLPFPHFLNTDPVYKAGWGKVRVRKEGSVAKPAKKNQSAVVTVAIPEQAAVEANPEIPDGMRIISEDSYVPAVDPTFVPWGFFEDLKGIIESKMFFPIYITGLSGNGKTLMPYQACALLGREIVRCNITKRTDELALFGGYELINGDTVRREGPVLTAMRRGAILLLDETDLGTEDLLCLQPILEGKPYLDKKTGVVVYPQPGFNVIATANTKGRGNEDGKFIGTNILNEAFLERFAITVEQGYPNEQIELEIMLRNFKELGVDEPQFAQSLVKWAAQIRKVYFDGGDIDEVISTRRLVHITKAFSVFKNRMKSIRLCLNRFDTEIKEAMIKTYEAIDPRAKGEPLATGPAGETRKATTAASAAGGTDIEYVLFSGALIKKFGTTVAIKNETMNGVKHVAVYSHGRKTTQALSKMPAVSQNREFEQAIQKMVETNKASAGTV